VCFVLGLWYSFNESNESMLLRIIFFLFLAVVILFGSHWFVYFSVTRLFSINSTAAKIWIAGTLLFLGVSFIGTSLLAHWSNNWLTRSLYLASSNWLGLLTNLFLAFAGAWLLVISTKHLFAWEAGNWIGGAAFLFAILFSVYGFWNAFHPQSKQINVSISNLPSYWQGKKIIQISDVHLGHIYRKDFLEKVVETINQENSELVVITGDLFDGMDGSLEELATPLGKIKAPRGILFVNGNHETYLGVEKTKNILNALGNVKILDDSMMTIEGLQFIGVGYPEREGKKNIQEVIASQKEFDNQKSSVLLFHSPSDIQAAKVSGISLQLSGHTHRGQIFPFNLVTHLMYKGYDTGFFQEGDFSLYVTTGTGTWGPAMRTGNQPEIVVINLK
jgi:predicted MPP superfamily phosphohydrolase